jgi:hypothetical protein
MFEFALSLPKNTRKEEVARYWRKLLRALDCSSYIFLAIETRGMRWAGNVARMEEKCIQSFGVENDGDLLEELWVSGCG